jgi:hypothetical protein
MGHTWLMKPRNFECVPSNFFCRLIHGSFGKFPNVVDVWFPCKCVMDSQRDWFSYCICLRATITSPMDGIIYSFEMDMAKKICKSKLWQEVGGPQSQQHIQRVGNPQPFEKIYV